MEQFLSNKCIQFLIRIIRWFPVIFIFCILIWGYSVYVFYICFDFVENLFQKIVYLIVFNILFVLLVWSYVQTIFTPIAFPPASFLLTKKVKDELCEAVDEQHYRNILEKFVRSNKFPVFNRAFEGGVRFCIKCSSIKPDRSHHCSICNHCILKFDHHCPWVNTCINHRNYKFFLLFLGYGFYLCVFGFFSILPYFISFLKKQDAEKKVFKTVHVVILFFVIGMFGVVLGCLFIYHLYLTAKNKSTIETFRPPLFSYGVNKNAYNLGIKRNYKEVFGKNKLIWFLPIFSTLGDGIVYQQFNENVKDYLNSNLSEFQIGEHNGNTLNQYGITDNSLKDTDKIALNSNSQKLFNPMINPTFL